MSHLTLLDTQLQSFQYLEKSLKRISQRLVDTNESKNVGWNQTDFLEGKLAKQVWGNFSVLLDWTSNGYNCVVDKEIFNKTSTSNLDILLDNVTQNYAIETILGETSNIGFEPLSYKENLDGSKTIVLERICEC